MGKKWEIETPTGRTGSATRIGFLKVLHVLAVDLDYGRAAVEHHYFAGVRHANYL